VRARSATYVFKEDLENTPGLFVDETGNTFDTTTTSKSTNSGLCYTYAVSARRFRTAGHKMMENDSP
jgi:hypothetical protein